MNCPKCGGSYYKASDGTAICSSCGYAAGAYPEQEFLRLVETLEWGAYQQAGHTVMAYLILEERVVDELFLVTTTDRELLLPEVSLLTIEDASAAWAKTTFSLRSLTSVPVVLLAGYIAASRKFNSTEAAFKEKSKTVKQALGFCRGYVAEMCGDDYPPNFDQIVQDLFDQHWRFAEQAIETYWQAVDELAGRLLLCNTMHITKAFNMIENYLAGNFNGH